ncbi:hypothetical protein [Oleiharenicola sp. Vm1]|uniref:hypothetical protein n=1 Tax=Oleiharenicola sp. Vm1 TaxID=3398393 RepID=UPI0039F4B16D
MKPKEKAEYAKLTTVEERAARLLRAAQRPSGVEVKPDVAGDSLDLCWRVEIAGVMMPQKYTCPTAKEASDQALAWLQSKAA